MMNYRFAKEHKMISKTRENFSRNKKIIDICDHFFQKICCLGIIETKDDHNVKYLLFKVLKLLIFISFLLMKLSEFLVVRFNTFLFILIKFIKFLVARFYALI